jgi:S-adenosylmethionine:tRNA ribosyltransferase-isomerase
MIEKEIRIEDYFYDLPADKIALFPLEERDASKLLVYKNKRVTEDVYRNLAAMIPDHSLLVFNNTKVIPARLLFPKETGGTIEIFVLSAKDEDMGMAMQKKESVQVHCLIGGASKWKKGMILKKLIPLQGAMIPLKARWLEKETDSFLVELEWGTPHDFSTIVAAAGSIPLPPYIKRKTAEMDKLRYQTIYAKHNGSVAAPTAGLHFTEHLLKQLTNRNIEMAFLTLHVGAGTFKPVQAKTMEQHPMHEEWISVDIVLLEKLRNRETPVFAVGTTSLRTLESLHWLGVKVLENPFMKPEALYLNQWDAYELPEHDNRVALHALLVWMQQNSLRSIESHTRMLIVPGYRFRMVDALITNFHQPKSTLLLLVAAVTGGNWNEIYQYALNNNFRFLSYGDGSLLFIEK